MTSSGTHLPGHPPAGLPFRALPALCRGMSRYVEGLVSPSGGAGCPVLSHLPSVSPSEGQGRRVTCSLPGVAMGSWVWLSYAGGNLRNSTTYTLFTDGKQPRWIGRDLAAAIAGKRGPPRGATSFQRSLHLPSSGPWESLSSHALLWCALPHLAWGLGSCRVTGAPCGAPSL